MQPVMVRSGHVTALRLFDVSYAIDLTRAEAIWAGQPQREGGRSRFGTTPAKAVNFGVAPLALRLEPVLLALGDRRVNATASVRLYDFGTAAFALQVPAEDMAWVDFEALVNAMDTRLGTAATGTPWQEMLNTVGAVLGEALDRPVATPLEEDYLLAVVHDFGGPLSANALMEQVDLVPLLSGETRRLSEGSRQALLRQRFSYFEDDLAVVTWDRAFLYEPRHETDVADVLEVANAQLLQMRYYDEMLDAELPRMYDLVEATRASASLWSARRYARLARRLHGMVAEVTEITERVDNALQVTEDVYLARVYAAAMDLFRVPSVSAAVDRKLNIVRDTYTALYSESHGGRAEVLEIAIVLLILFEIVMTLFP
ncbi:hypothetical protein ACQW02_26830 [Humitalea sp. 24SJ18S-53]|uniref:hypothetical protein n=1 Tax=Humitalea sp. 24SJ18S-53 TaxID=3422307 RepID=UPI003D67CD95